MNDIQRNSAVRNKRSFRDVFFGSYNKELNENFNIMQNEIQELKASMQSIEVQHLKMMVIEERLPKIERILSYKRYRELGGNGSIAAVYDTELKETDAELSSIAKFVQ